MTENQPTIPETTVPEMPEVSRNRKFAAVAAKTATTLVVTIIAGVVTEVATQKVSNLILKPAKPTN